MNILNIKTLSSIHILIIGLLLSILIINIGNANLLSLQENTDKQLKVIFDILQMKEETGEKLDKIIQILKPKSKEELDATVQELIDTMRLLIKKQDEKIEELST